MKEEYTQVRLELSGFDKDVLSAVLFAEGCTGVEEVYDKIWNVYFPPDWPEKSLGRVFDRLLQLNPALSPDQFLASRIETRDWNEEWKKYFHPLRVGRRVVVVPPWEKPEIQKDEILLIVNPQMAFGTGGHETTQLMIEAMEQFVEPVDRVLDAGTGSGILAVLAKKMGCGHVFAFDNDSSAIDNARENGELNDTKDIEFAVGDESVIPGSHYQAVLANIIRQVLLEMMPVLCEKVDNKGLFILSGLLEDDLEQIRNSIPVNFSERAVLKKNDWRALVFQKNK